MKALSVKQPWAALIASGRKTIETRTWKTSYRGPLLIVSSKKPDKYYNPSRAGGYALTMEEWACCVYGCTVCIVHLVDCRPMTEADEEAAGCAVYDGAMSWVLWEPRSTPHLPVRGMPGLFEVAGPVGVQLPGELSRIQVLGSGDCPRRVTLLMEQPPKAGQLPLPGQMALFGDANPASRERGGLGYSQEALVVDVAVKAPAWGSTGKKQRRDR